MKTTARNFAISAVGMPVSVLLLRWTQSDIFFVLLILCFIASILLGMDLGRKLRALRSPSALQRVAGILLGVPQALFGLLSIALGASIGCWVLYNSFVQKQPQYSGGFLTFGISPALILVGAAWTARSFRREREDENAV